jgi:hypothetical protein
MHRGLVGRRNPLEVRNTATAVVVKDKLAKHRCLSTKDYIMKQQAKLNQITISLVGQGRNRDSTRNHKPLHARSNSFVASSPSGSTRAPTLYKNASLH